MDILKKLFIATLFFFIFGEIIRIDFGNGISFRPIDMGVAVVVIYWLIFKFRKKKKINQKNILAPILFFAGSGLLSLLISSHKLSINQFIVSLMYLIRWVAYSGIFFVVSDFDKKFREKISKLLIIVGFLIVGLGYIQYFYYSDLHNLIYLGWDEHMYRMFSVFFDPNFAGAFFVLFFLFLASLFMKKKSVSIGSLLILTLGAVFLTFSRSALIMLIVSSSALFILVNKKVLIAGLLGITLIVLLISSKYSNIENINVFRIVSSEARIETAKNAIQIIEKNPIFGVGFNAYRYAQFKYGFRGEASIASHADASPDNSFLFITATTGIVGFILFMFLWLRILKIASFLAIASIIGIFVDSMFINSLFYSFIMLWLWIVLALSVNQGE